MAINRFGTDTDAELALVKKAVLSMCHVGPTETWGRRVVSWLSSQLTRWTSLDAADRLKSHVMLLYNPILCPKRRS